MKILKFFLLAITVVSFVACSSDDDSNGDDGAVQVELTTDNLVGSYEIIFYAGSGQTSVAATGGATVITETDVYSGRTFTNARLNLNNDGSYTLSGSYVETYTISVAGQSPMTDEEIVILDESAMYSFSNTNRTITLDGELFDVLNFDGTNLRIENSYEETFPGGITETDTFEFRLRKLL